MVDHLVCSDLIRTQQTAQPALQVLLPQARIETLTDSSLREQHFGVVDGLRVEDVKTDHADAWAQWLRFDADYGMPGGETTRQFHTRVMDAVRRIAQQRPGQKVMVVTHGGVLDIAHRLATGQALQTARAFAIPNAALNWIEHTAGSWKLIAWADESHLQGALDELPDT